MHPIPRLSAQRGAARRIASRRAICVSHREFRPLNISLCIGLRRDSIMPVLAGFRFYLDFITLFPLPVPVHVVSPSRMTCGTNNAD